MKNRRWVGLFLLPALLVAFGFGSSQRRVFQLSGKIVQSDGSPLRFGAVLLFSATTPFNVQTWTDVGGDFTFKNLLPGAYDLFVVDRIAGEINETIEVGPSFADKNGKITTKVVFDRDKAVRPRHRVSVTDLSVPQKARNEVLKALKLAEKRDFAGAVKWLKRAVAIAPQFAAAWNYLGTISYQAGAFQDAEMYFREALKYEVDSFDALENLGGALIALHRYEDSLPVNLQAVKIRPQDALAQAQLGQSYFYLGQLDIAEVHLKQAKALDPAHFSFPQITLAAIYRKRGSYDAAIKELEEFLRLHPDSASAPYARRELTAIRALAK